MQEARDVIGMTFNDYEYRLRNTIKKDTEQIVQYLFLAPPARLERATTRLTAECSTD